MKSLGNVFILVVLMIGGGGFLLFLHVESANKDAFTQTVQTVSRYDMVRLIAEANCQDCMRPPLPWKQKYTSSWLASFKGLLRNYFDDIVHEQARFNGESYYYCVVHAGDQGWINGYPRLSPGLCQGKFCGENNARGTELVQIITNMIAPKVWKHYPISFEAIKRRSIASGTINDLESIGLINKGLVRCGEKPCIASSLEEFQLYMKYCTHHLDQCKMKVIPPFKQGQRPIAELNVLYHANIITFDDPMITRLGSVITIDDMSRFLSTLKQVTSCVSLVDYDGDKVPNDRDNCTDNYNPTQRNFDNDSFGDVCDDDIDGDGALHDKNMVDDTGLLLKQPIPGQDDCPFVVNQLLGTYDCATYLSEKLLAFDIQANPYRVYVGEQVSFTTRIVGDIQSLNRDFGDGKQGTGIQPTHSYSLPGTYPVIGHVRGRDGRLLQSLAEVTVIISGAQTTNPASMLVCDPLSGNTTTKFGCLLGVDGVNFENATMLRRHRGDGTVLDYTSNIGSQLKQSHVYHRPGTYTIKVQLFFGLETLITQQLVVYVMGGDICSNTTLCDMDQDGIPDQCDADIDGDGVINIIGLLIKDLPNCRINLENIDILKLSDQIDAIKKGIVYDNCSFVNNKDQKDDDLDGIGDVCDAKEDTKDNTGYETGDNLQPSLPLDRDRDGILDDRDACEDIPENKNGVEDKDGCPELPTSCKPGSTCRGKAPMCNTCPCPGADYASALRKGDKIRAVLMDEAGQIIYNYSPAEVIDLHIPDVMLGR